MIQELEWDDMTGGAGRIVCRLEDGQCRPLGLKIGHCYMNKVRAGITLNKVKFRGQDISIY